MMKGAYRTEADLPCAAQTAASVFLWAQQLKIGDQVGLRQTLAHIDYEYRLGTVEAFTDGGRRVMIKDTGTFWRTKNAAGNNCFYPKGQLSMIEPTAAVVAAAQSGARYSLGNCPPRTSGTA